VTLVHRGKPQVDLPTEGRSKNEECRNMTPKAVPGLLGGVFVSKRDTRSRGTPLRYRGCTVVPPYQHRSNTLAGRWVHRCPQNRLRFPCRSQPPRCRGSPAPHLTHSGFLSALGTHGWTTPAVIQKR
jgi:hypothetical protein